MAREIKFRGKAMDWKWKYGLLTKKKIRNSGKISYAIAKDDCSLINTIPINEDTIGEFTGFKDIDCKEIFEGDIIQNDECPENVGYVELFRGGWHFNRCGALVELCWALEDMPFKVIGNIHDNPELLEGGKADDEDC